MNTIYQFIKRFLDNKMSNFEEYGALNISSLFMPKGICSNEVQSRNDHEHDV